ncbi:MAG TPA: amino acid racemase [Thermoanaerobaculia bacterium]|nr:amino acid racemase [Thermoanaerobaculia bacterium]
MKVIGIIGGIAPESTIEYYRFILDGYRARRRDGSAPSVLINSIDLQKMIGFIARGQLAEVTDYLEDELQRLVLAGADFALFASNTPHIVFHELRARSPIPLISIVEATCDAASSMHLKRLGLFGTRFTMEARFYPDVFARKGIELFVPDAEERAFVHDRYMSELVNGVFLPDTRDRLLAIVDRLIERHAIDGLILGGTELPLILRDSGTIPFLDTTRIHVARVLDELLTVMHGAKE